MTDYRDGNWHDWGGGQRPVDPRDKVEAFTVPGSGTALHCTTYASQVKWSQVRVFRVTKAHREPREWWLVGIRAYDEEDSAKHFAYLEDAEIVHVREVLE